ncbi:MAG: histidinol-phosphate transaminase [Desulfobacterium sp.]
MTTPSNPSVPGIRSAIKGVTAYQPGSFIEEVQGDLKMNQIIKIASNENPYGPYPESIKRMAQEIEKLNQYPDSNFKALRQTLGRVHGISPESICLSHGAEGMLQTIGKCFLQEDDEVIVPAATYTLYKEISKVMGARVIEVPMDREAVDLSAIKTKVGPKTKIIWLANPNNPTGTLVNKNTLNQLLDDLPPHAWVILDEAYAEFADAVLLPDRVSLIEAGRRIISVRTFSKAYGLAGARLGYAIAAPPVITVINTVSEPFNANRIAIAGALGAINGDGDHFQKNLALMIQDRKNTEKRLKYIGLRVIPSQTNFIMFETPIPARKIFNTLLKQGIIVRPCDAWGYSHMMRVSIGTTAQMDTFIKALSLVLQSAEVEMSQFKTE